MGGGGRGKVPDDAGAGGGGASFSGEAAEMSLEGEGGGMFDEDSCVSFFGAAAEPPEKNDAIDRCMWRGRGRGWKKRNVLGRGVGWEGGLG